MKFLRSDSVQSSHPGLGGKAQNLARLQRLTIHVPKWLVIPAEELFDHISVEALESLSSEDICACIDHFEIPGEALSEIIEYFEPDCKLAVRSSALDEDGEAASFAGLYESYLYVPPEQLADRIKAVWKSAFSKRVESYRNTKNLSSKPGIAVIIQEMVDAEVSGVAFGMHPVSGDRNVQVVNAVYGLGEGLVSGALNADTYEINGAEIHRQIARKLQAFQFDQLQGHGCQKVVLETALQNQACLNAERLHFLSTLLKQLEAHFGSPQDIEFAWSGDQFYLLQSRPISSIPSALQKEGRRMVWDNSNIVESYPGLTSPLTFSFILKMYEGVYRQLTALFGVSQKEIDNHSQLFARMLGLIKGRVYYNLYSWYRVLAILPGYKLNARFMEGMMGVKERFDLPETTAGSKVSALIGLFRMIGRMLYHLFSLPRQVRHFQQFFDRFMTRYDQMDFDSMNPEEIMLAYRNMEQSLLKKWNAPQINDFFAMIFFGLLKSACQKLEGNSENLHNDLLCGSGDIISTEPIHKMNQIARLIHQNAAAKKQFQQVSAKEVYEKLQQGAFPEIDAAIQEYIQRFGDRCIGELKLESISYKQEPLLFIQMLQSYIQNGLGAETETHSHSDEIRQKAEQKLKRALKGRWIYAKWLGWVLKKTRILVRNRENLRFARTRAFGLVRTMMRAMGTQWQKREIIQHVEDIFFLKMEEIFNQIEGTACTEDPAALIALRKTAYAEFEQQQPAERIQTFGMVYHGNDLLLPWKPSQPRMQKQDLSGIGCCPGRVRGRVCVIQSPDDLKDLKGDILVTRNTDPGWVPLFPTASAILVERGSLLSHAAIVSREMGKPCIVGIEGLLEQLQTGDWIEMDGSSGQIRIIPEKELVKDQETKKDFGKKSQKPQKAVSV